MCIRVALKHKEYTSSLNSWSPRAWNEPQEGLRKASRSTFKQRIQRAEPYGRNLKHCHWVSMHVRKHCIFTPRVRRAQRSRVSRPSKALYTLTLTALLLYSLAFRVTKPSFCECKQCILANLFWDTQFPTSHKNQLMLIGPRRFTSHLHWDGRLHVKVDRHRDPRTSLSGDLPNRGRGRS